MGLAAAVGRVLAGRLAEPGDDHVAGDRGEEGGRGLLRTAERERQRGDAAERERDAGDGTRRTR